MQIMILTQYYPPEIGAAQIRLSEMAGALVRQGHTVTVVTAFPNHPSGVIPPDYRGHRFLKERGAHNETVIRTWVFPVQSRDLKRRMLTYMSFALSCLYGVVGAGKMDVIFVESPPLTLALSAWLASKIKRAPYVFNVSDLWPASAVEMGMVGDGPVLRMAEWLEGFAYKHAKLICGVTRGICDTIASRALGPEVWFLPNGSNPDAFVPMQSSVELRDSLGLQGKHVFLYAGTIGYAQSLGTVLDAATLLRHRDDIAFLIVGDGPEREPLRARAETECLTNVVFLEAQPRERMSEVFSICDASLVLLRKLELFKGARPSKIFASLSCARPVIYCGEGESVELLEKAAAGVVVEPENPAALAEAVVRVADASQDWREAMGENGRRLIVEEYSWERIMGGWADRIERLLATSVRRPAEGK